MNLRELKTKCSSFSQKLRFNNVAIRQRLKNTFVPSTLVHFVIRGGAGSDNIHIPDSKNTNIIIVGITLGEFDRRAKKLCRELNRLVDQKARKSIYVYLVDQLEKETKCKKFDITHYPSKNFSLNVVAQRSNINDFLLGCVENSVDYVLTDKSVIQHIDQREEKFYPQLAKVVRPGGEIMLQDLKISVDEKIEAKVIEEAKQLLEPTTDKVTSFKINFMEKKPKYFKTSSAKKPCNATILHLKAIAGIPKNRKLIYAGMERTNATLLSSFGKGITFHESTIFGQIPETIHEIDAIFKKKFRNSSKNKAYTMLSAYPISHPSTDTNKPLRAAKWIK